MYIKDLTTEEFQDLIRRTIVETLNDYSIEPEEAAELLPSIQEKSLEIQADRRAKDETLIAAEAYAELDLN